jgi:hypothetical protein
MSGLKLVMDTMTRICTTLNIYTYCLMHSLIEYFMPLIPFRYEISAYSAFNLESMMEEFSQFRIVEMAVALGLVVSK